MSSIGKTPAAHDPIDESGPTTEATPSEQQADAPAADGAASAWNARLESVNRNGEPTALERHVLFFDTNNDRELSVGEVRRGLGRLGMDSWIERVFASTVNNALLAPPTQGRLISFTIDIDNIEKARHVGNTGIFDAGGDFVPAKFEEMFARFDVDGDGRLTAKELQAMVDVNTTGMSSRSRGRFSADAEFKLLTKICAYEDAGGERFVTKDRMLRFYDGSLFDDLAAQVKADGKIDRRAPHGEEAIGASGPLPDRARRSAGPAAGPAAGALYGEALLTAPEAGSAAGAAVLGGMLSVCPYAGAKPGSALQ